MFLLASVELLNYGTVAFQHGDGRQDRRGDGRRDGVFLLIFILPTFWLTWIQVRHFFSDFAGFQVSGFPDFPNFAF